MNLQRLHSHRGSGPVLALLLAASCVTGAATQESRLVVGAVDGSEHVLVPFDGAGATVLVFTATTCPIANAYSPEIQRIRAEYEPLGVRFFLVYADCDDTAELVREHLESFGYEVPGLLDHDQRVRRRVGAEVTPEAFVLDGSGEVLYRGRIDDTYVDYGKQRAAPSRRDLRLALDAVLAGGRPEVDLTQAIGCYIPDPPASIEGTRGS